MFKGQIVIFAFFVRLGEKMRNKELSDFCMQISFLLSAGITIDGGLLILAEDSQSQMEKQMLQNMSMDVASGVTLAESMKNRGDFPAYVVKMTNVAQETGTLESVMRELSDYYSKENSLANTIKNGITYPIIMVFMLVSVLYILLSRVMPIFEGVYKQLGAQVSPITRIGAEIGSYITGSIMILIGLFGVFALFAYIKSGSSGIMKFAEKLLAIIKEKSSIAQSISKRRFASIMATCIGSGLDTDKAMEMSEELVSNEIMKKRIKKARLDMENGNSLYQALKENEIFSALDLQMIKVGIKSGKLDVVLKELANRFESEVDEAIEKMITRFEPTLVIGLAIIVGLILAGVMLPLVGIMSAIG